MSSKEKKLNIIYLCTAEKGPSGGAKNIYNHSDKINKLKIKNLSSEVLHIKKKRVSKLNISIKKVLKISSDAYTGWQFNDIKAINNFKSKWLNTNIRLKNNFVFDKNKDFIIFPEIFAHFAKELCLNENIQYGIFVQNGYSLNSTSNEKVLKEVYDNAKFILSYSKNINDCIELAFPKCCNKIIKTNISINVDKFNFNVKKKNIISYMPRKLPVHSNNLIFFLKKHLPKTWKLKSLHNLKETDVYKNLVLSKIFLSFSDLEGLGMPPIEAALAKNIVIGYPGEGGKEYWKKPIFKEIPQGNIIKFFSEIMISIKKNKFNKFEKYRKKLAKKYSIENEKKYLLHMVKKIKSTLLT